MKTTPNHKPGSLEILRPGTGSQAGATPMMMLDAIRADHRMARRVFTAWTLRNRAGTRNTGSA